MKGREALSSGAIWIGTSNVEVPGPKKDFPPAFQNKTRLHYYASLFNSVEINSSFYKVPLAATFEKWATQVPDDFRFSIKLWRDITHAHGLIYNPMAVELFMQAASHLGPKAGCLLIQLPPRLTKKYFDDVALLVKRVAQHGWRVAVEFRHASWYMPETFQMLDEAGATLVLHDMPGSAVQEPTPNAQFIYLRLHGPSGYYKESYSAEALQQLAVRIDGWRAQGKDVFVYFNNTIGDAFHNAQSLKGMVGIKK